MRENKSARPSRWGAHTAEAAYGSVERPRVALVKTTGKCKAYGGGSIFHSTAARHLRSPNCVAAARVPSAFLAEEKARETLLKDTRVELEGGFVGDEFFLFLSKKSWI